jgi:translation initiation factor 5
MALININSDIQDEYFRYKMPEISIKFERNKTILINIEEISKSLKRPAIYILKYFGYELCTQVTCDIKSKKYYIKGYHESNKLKCLIDKFINIYLICINCRNPETLLCIYPKLAKIEKKCCACGEVKQIRQKEKLDIYMLKNPPKAIKGR